MPYYLYSRGSPRAQRENGYPIGWWCVSEAILLESWGMKETWETINHGVGGVDWGERESASKLARYWGSIDTN